jgi:hypothetical protein
MKSVKLPFVDLVDLVKREAKGEISSDEQNWLLQPENIDQWKIGLEAAIDDCLLQFEDWEDRLARVRLEVKAGVLSQDAYERTMDNYEIWRKKASRYRLGLEQKLLEISLLDEDREPIVDTLVNAISAHKEELKREATGVDLKLWSLIENIDG